MARGERCRAANHEADVGHRLSHRCGARRHHHAVRDAPQLRFSRVVGQVRAVGRLGHDVDTASGLIVQAVSYRSSVARHRTGAEPDPMDREVTCIADAVTAGQVSPRARPAR